jgi:hypothetical protein
VITLPIFVLIFAFMVNLYNYEVTLNRVRYRAATNMWEEAMQVQRDGTSPTSPHGLPPQAASDANSIVSGSSSYAGDAEQTTFIGAMATGRTGDEMVAGAGFMGVGGGDPANVTSLELSEGIAEDGLADPLPTANNDPVQIFSWSIPKTVAVTRHAGIIGTRYGMVEGTDTGTADAGNWGTATMDAQYDVLVSPVSIPADDHKFVVGASRLFADQNPCMETVLEISWSLSDC